MMSCRRERCRNEVGSLDGLPETRVVTHTVTSVVTGRPDRKASGTVVLISSAKFQMIRLLADMITSVDWLTARLLA